MEFGLYARSCIIHSYFTPALTDDQPVVDPEVTQRVANFQN